MPTELRKEPFVGPYDGIIPAVLAQKGTISDGKNIRKVSMAGGWKSRKGSILNNTTAAESGAAIKSLHRYVNPLQDDSHFIAQVNSKLLDATNDPPAAGTTFGTDLGVTVGTNPGFSTIVGETFFYADGTGIPIAWGGDDPSPIGFFTYDDSESVWNDFVKEVTDRRTDTVGLILAAAADHVIVLTQERAEGFTIDLGDVNSNAVTMTVSAWRSGSWTGVSALSDGTETGGTTTLAQDGTVTWTRSTSDTLKIVENKQGYAYKITWSGALSGTVTVKSLTVVSDADNLSNKWDGTWEWVIGASFYDQSATEYQECLGKLTNESDSQYVDISEATTSDYLYAKTPEPATGFGVGIPVGYGNTDAGNVDLIEYWDGDSWVTCGTLNDTTLNGAGTDGFSQTGKITFDGGTLSPIKRTFAGDDLPGYWYRISWDAALSTDVRIYAMFYAAVPDDLPTAFGCIEFKGRLMLWEDSNRLRFSVKDKPFCFCGTDSGQTDPFGGEDRILCVKKFYNELLIVKESSVYLLEGYSPATFGSLEISATVGCVSASTLKVAEVGYPGMKDDEPQSIAIWTAVDGVYVLDGRKPKKISHQVTQFFDTDYTTAIAAADLDDLQSFIDPIKNEYHLLTVNDGELVFNYVLDQWFPPWEREINLTCGINLRGTDKRNYVYGGSASGFVIRLENGTVDKDTSNSNVDITSTIKSRGLAAFEEGGVTYEFVMRKIWAELKAQSAGTITTKTFKNLATSGTTQAIPAAMIMTNSGYNLTVDFLTVSITGCYSIQIEMSTTDPIEIWSMLYELEVQRPIGQ